MLQAIETVYNGYRFRSRIEARWAVFFDVLGVPYEYEKEGFDLGNGMYYLPDFWLPAQNCWIEIKGAAPTIDESAKATRLAEYSGKSVYVFYGDIAIPDTSSHIYSSAEASGGDEGYWWCECPVCGRLGIEFNGRAARLPCRCVFLLVNSFNEERLYEIIRANVFDSIAQCSSWRHPDKCYNYESPRLVTAYNAARAARFEHGENGYEQPIAF